MVKNRFGRIINISSISGLMGNPGQVNYSSSKSALNGFTKSLAKELGSRNITVNCVAPGFITTAMTEKLTDQQKNSILDQIPCKRMGSAAEVAAATLYLSSAEAAFTTGSTIHVNGGMAMF